jgi:hypothetical protein
MVPMLQEQRQLLQQLSKAGLLASCHCCTVQCCCNPLCNVQHYRAEHTCHDIYMHGVWLQANVQCLSHPQCAMQRCCSLCGLCRGVLQQCQRGKPLLLESRNKQKLAAALYGSLYIQSNTQSIERQKPPHVVATTARSWRSLECTATGLSTTSNVCGGIRMPPGRHTASEDNKDNRSGHSLAILAQAQDGTMHHWVMNI